jgi:hypothetical protein
MARVAPPLVVSIHSRSENPLALLCARGSAPPRRRRGEGTPSPLSPLRLRRGPPPPSALKGYPPLSVPPTRLPVKTLQKSVTPARRVRFTPRRAGAPGQPVPARRRQFRAAARPVRRVRRVETKQAPGHRHSRSRAAGRALRARLRAAALRTRHGRRLSRGTRCKSGIWRCNSAARTHVASLGAKVRAHEAGAGRSRLTAEGGAPHTRLARREDVHEVRARHSAAAAAGCALRCHSAVAFCGLPERLTQLPPKSLCGGSARVLRDGLEVLQVRRTAPAERCALHCPRSCAVVAQGNGAW